MVHGFLVILEILLGGPLCQNYFHDDAKCHLCLYCADVCTDGTKPAVVKPLVFYVLAQTWAVAPNYR